MRQKEEFPDVGGVVQNGDPSHLPPPQWQVYSMNQYEVVKIGGFRNNPLLGRGDKTHVWMQKAVT